MSKFACCGYRRESERERERVKGMVRWASKRDSKRAITAADGARARECSYVSIVHTDVQILYRVLQYRGSGGGKGKRATGQKRRGGARGVIIVCERKHARACRAEGPTIDCWVSRDRETRDGQIDGWM